MSSAFRLERTFASLSNLKAVDKILKSKSAVSIDRQCTDDQGCFEYSRFEYKYEYEYFTDEYEYEYEYISYEYEYEYEYNTHT